ncbi:MAG: 5'-nucleotidase C-terminal domain-containing protein [Flaviflexus sp.]|uniref:bifunctional metallophosphatase/5'-nucleotidase n=1 Tax=Flaviflexus sp. TaxID=1969482 RepID=UPI00352C41DE
MTVPASATTADEGDRLRPQNTNTEPVTIDLVGITDFHGYIETAPYLATQVDGIRESNPNTVFVSAGDNIGGSAYVSSIAEDQPTLDILDAMGLDVSAVGNHEFDKGYGDLTDRVIPDVDFKYLGANVGGATEIAEPPYSIDNIDGVNVAFVGTVTETTPTIVAKDGVAGLTFTDPVAKTNEVAAQLKDGDDSNGEADVVVALFHESNELAAGLGENVDVVFAGHTHVESETTTTGGAPILQAGQYGEAYAHVSLTVDAEGAVTIDSSDVVAVRTDGATDADIQALVDEALAQADVLGAEQLATTTDNAWRGTNSGSDVGANRGTESSMGNHLANSALQVADNFEMGADFGIINPGGIRHDMDHTPADGIVTYGEAYSTQPFGNTIGTIDLTGAQVKTMLEQQYQNNAGRPVLRLGLSDNVTYTYDQTIATDDAVFAGEGSGVITGVWIDGKPVVDTETYTVASNTFLLAGQDGFTVFADGTNLRETGYVDLAGYVDYLRAGNGDTIPAGQRSIGLDYTDLVRGEAAEINLSSLTFTALEEKPETVTLYINGEEIGSSEIDTTVAANRDNAGTATVEVEIPATVVGNVNLQVVTTYADGSLDTDVNIPVRVANGGPLIDVVGITDFHGYIETAPFLKTQIDAIRADNPNTEFVSAGDNIGGSAYISSIAEDQPTLDILDAMGLDVSAVGNHEFDKGYADLTDRVIPDVDFNYLGANVGGADEIAEPPYELVEIDGVTVAYIGTVTATTPSIVAKDGVAGLAFTDPVAKTNDVAAQLKDGNDENGEADVVIALFHEGNEAAVNFGDDVDLVFAGHTHVESETETASGAPILQAGQYGEAFGHARISVIDGDVEIVRAEIVGLDNTVAPDAEIQALVDEAKTEADVLGAEELATTDENAWRGTNNGSDVGGNRGTESSMGNHLANSALFVADNFEMGADFGIINPGGIRNDMDHTPVDGIVTYGEAYSTQPFGNTIGTIDLTGAQVYTMLEQQFQNNASRPVLRLGLSDNVTYTYDQSIATDDAVFAGEGTGVITGVWIDGEPVDLDATYTIASNTFLLTGQDGFTVFEDGTNVRETGYVDLAGYVDYLRAGYGNDIPEGQRSIGIAHDDLVAGATADIELSSLTFTAFEEKPETVTLYIDGTEVGSADIDASVVPNRDNAGTATVSVTVPASADGEVDLRIVTEGEFGGETDVTVPVTVGEAEEPQQPVRSKGNWMYVSNDWTSSQAGIEFGYGRASDEVLVGDWDGDGVDTFAVRRGNEFFVKNSVAGGNADVTFKYGRAGDDVLVGDWDGDGTDTLAVRRGREYFVKNTLVGGNADVTFKYGRNSDLVFAGDFDGDSTDTLAVRRGDSILVKNTLAGGNADVQFNYGRTTDTVFVGDWDGDGADTFGIRRGSTFHLKNELKGGAADLSLNYGRSTDTVFIGDWDGDGVDTPAVRR